MWATGLHTLHDDEVVMSIECSTRWSDSIAAVSLDIVLLGAGIYFVGGLMVHGVIVSLLGGVSLAVCKIVGRSRKGEKAVVLPRKRKRFAIIMVVLMFCDGACSVCPLPRTRIFSVEYTRIRHRWWANKATVAHFPTFIPWEAKNVKVFFFPGFLMAPRVFEVGMELPIDAIDDIAEKYDRNPTTVRGYQNLRQRAGSYIYNEKFKLPEHFTIKVIHSEPYKKNNWNHGLLYGVAYSRQTNQVVYFSSYW